MISCLRPSIWFLFLSKKKKKFKTDNSIVHTNPRVIFLKLDFGLVDTSL